VTRRARIALRVGGIALIAFAALLEAGGRAGGAIGDEPMPTQVGNPRTPDFVARAAGGRPPHRILAMDGVLRIAFLGDVQRGVGDVARSLAAVVRDQLLPLVVQHGDLVSHGEAPYYGVTGKTLRRAGYAPLHTWVVPGNHDIEPDGVRTWDEGRRLFEERIGPRWWSAVATAPDARSLTPGDPVAPKEPFALVVGLDDSVEPVGEDQLRFLDAALASYGNGRWILAIHKPPRLLDQPGTPPMPGMEPLVERLEAKPPIAVVSGHLHEDLDVTVNGVRYLINANGGDLDSRGPTRPASLLLMEMGADAKPTFRRVPLERRSWLAVDVDRLWIRLWSERRRAPWAPWVALALGFALLVVSPSPREPSPAVRA
jgi:hypothetical protein